MEKEIEINEDVKSLLEANKKMKVCETLKGHRSSTYGRHCDNCGAVIDVNNYQDKSDKTLASLFSRGINRQPIERFIDRISMEEYERDFTLSKYVSGAKYLIENIFPKLRSVDTKSDILAIAYIFGYYDGNYEDASALANRFGDAFYRKALLTRYTINKTRDIKSFMMRAYDKEQIDELFFFDENIPIISEFRGYQAPLIKDEEYFSRKMTELYEQKKFKKLKIFGSMFIRPDVFREIDSRFIPFTGGETINKLKGNPILSEYKQEIIDNYKYVEEDNMGEHDGRALSILSKVEQKPKGEDRMVVVSEDEYYHKTTDKYNEERGYKVNLRFIP